MSETARYTLDEALALGPPPAGFLFVGAGQPHRFEAFSPDLAVWVFFYGPRGGESDARSEP